MKYAIPKLYSLNDEQLIMRCDGGSTATGSGLTGCESGAAANGSCDIGLSAGSPAYLCNVGSGTMRCSNGSDAKAFGDTCSDGGDVAWWNQCVAGGIAI